jgi:hypothetical protein
LHAIQEIGLTSTARTERVGCGSVDIDIGFRSKGTMEQWNFSNTELKDDRQDSRFTCGERETNQADDADVTGEGNMRFGPAAGLLSVRFWGSDLGHHADAGAAIPRRRPYLV